VLVFVIVKKLFAKLNVNGNAGDGDGGVVAEFNATKSVLELV
jgi:hypothetical protein